MTTKKSTKISKKNICEGCNYSTSKNSEFNKHLLTNKHINTTKYNNSGVEKIKEYLCLCGKKYNHRASLFNHKKKCNYQDLTSNNEISKNNITNDVNNNNVNNNVIQILINENKELITDNKDFKNIIMELVKSNNELQKQITEVYKTGTNITNTNINVSNTHTNNNNKTFNLQFFLNEQCKDAMNISEFINSVTLSVQDLERVGTLGYVEGISSIIIKELGNLDIHKRPMHCSDTKRETLYIKDENKWEKEDHENKKIKNVIKSVEHKNLKMINEWTKEHPNYKESKEKDNDTYLKILMEATGSPGNYEEKGNKIIKKIAKAVTIEKEVNNNTNK
jgi:hypothetical protein